MYRFCSGFGLQAQNLNYEVPTASIRTATHFLSFRLCASVHSIWNKVLDTILSWQVSVLTWVCENQYWKYCMGVIDLLTHSGVAVAQSEDRRSVQNDNRHLDWGGAVCQYEVWKNVPWRKHSSSPSSSISFYNLYSTPFKEMKNTFKS